MCLNPGEILAKRYKIIDKLGCGGFAITYTANDLSKPGNPVCVIKKIPFPQSENPLVLERARNRFQREASALHILGKDSRIPELFDRFEDNNNFYLVQEFIEGTPVSQELTQNRQWTEAQTIAFLLEILEILILLHQANIIHRDITPSNIIRRKKDRKLALIDFGAVKEISTFTSNSTGEIFTSQAIGTDGYMPAEQYNPQSAPRPYNDIYEVGIIAIQSLTGRHPRNLPHDPDTCEIIWDHLTSEKVSTHLKKILNKMVRFNFQHRYQSANEILQVLERKGRNFRPLLFGVAGLGAGLAIALLIPRLLQQPPVSAPVPSPSVPTNPSVSCLDGISSGEKALLQEKPIRSKQRAIDAFVKLNYLEALELFKYSWREDRKDPETLIYMNNALIKARQVEYYTIAIVIPTRRNQAGKIINANLAEELLRGIAQAQTEVNLSLLTPGDSNKGFPGQDFLKPNPINGKGLRVIIADDANIKSEAIKRANCLVARPDILAVIGHYTSDMMVEAVDIYNTNKLVAISPGSSTEELTQKHRKFFFRTAPADSIEAESLVTYLLKVDQKKATGFYNPNSPFTASLWKEFKKQFESNKGSLSKINKSLDLSKSDFSAQTAIKEIDDLKTKTALVIIPDGQVTNSVENALDMIKANNDRYWIVAPWTLYDRTTLEVVKQLKSVEKLAISTPWHPLTSFDKEFPENAEKLWGGPVNTRSALTYDASQALIKALEMQAQPSREGMQKTLADPNFNAKGATGIIEFEPNTSNRKNSPKGLVHIVPCSTKEFGLTFVPIEFPTAAAAGLKCE